MLLGIKYAAIVWLCEPVEQTQISRSESAVCLFLHLFCTFNHQQKQVELCLAMIQTKMTYKLAYFEPKGFPSKKSAFPI